MRILATLGAAALLLTFLGATPASAAPAIPLNGEQEAAAGDDDGHGFFTYDLDGTTFCSTLQWSGIETATAAHVHKAPRNVAGPIVIPLSVGDGSGARVSECSQIDPALAADLAANPKAYYINVHNAPFPAGAIRGQLK
ncbi:MAG: CHRD domain-containing protein [Streptosporangiales bacterium]|nr:CHRD domain-containing protein [Streptosporangiales bacterium]